MSVPYPARRIVREHAPGSRLPLVLVGARGPEQVDGWSDTEKAVRRSRYYLGPRVVLPRRDLVGEELEASLVGFLTDLLSHTGEHHGNPIAGLVVPDWGGLSPRLRSVVTLASLVHAEAGDLQPRRRTLPVATIGPRGAGARLRRPQTRCVEVTLTDPALVGARDALLGEERFLAALDQLGESDDDARRGPVGAREVVRELAGPDRSTFWLANYLRTYGFARAGTLVGRWTPQDVEELLGRDGLSEAGADAHGSHTPFRPAQAS